MLVGPSFEHDRIRDLVPTRQGMGPVWVAWDTNALSLYERYGAAMWEGKEPTVTGTDPDEVEALFTLIFVWLWCDLRVACQGDGITALPGGWDHLVV